MTRPGEITDKRGGMLEVTFCRPEACAKCGACSGGRRQTVLWVKGEGDVGDIAVVDMPEKTIRRASVLAYVMPLVLLLGGILAGTLASGGNEIIGVIGGLAGLVAAVVVLKVTEKYRAGRKGWTPELIEVLPKDDKDDALTAALNDPR